MKKFLILFVVLITIGSIQAYAEKNSVVMEYYQTGHVDRSTTVRRSYMRTFIDVYYDDVSNQLEFIGEECIDAQIFLYDENGNTLAYSPFLNTILDVSHNYKGQIFIRIEGIDWIAIGRIVV